MADVERAVTECRVGGCRSPLLGGLLREAIATIETLNGRGKMSVALWCDQGGHAFSERDPGRQRVGITILNDDGQEVEEARDLCGQCASQAGLLRPRQTRPQVAAHAAPAPPPYPSDTAPPGYSYPAYTDPLAASGG